MKTKISKKLDAITSFIVMDVLERAQELEKAGKNVIHLEVGEPDFNTPKPIIEATTKALNTGKTGYTNSLGLLELREAISKHYNNKYNVNISPEQIIVTSGTSPALLIIFQTLLEENDEVILSNPYYPCYPNFVIGAGAKPVYSDTTEENGFQYDIQKVKQAVTNRTKALLVNSPSNPTGTVYAKDKLQALAGLRIPYIISDEIYHGLNYGENRDHTMLEFSDRAIVINGFSKIYAMTGWRLGYLIAPPDLIRPFQKLQQNYFISANNFVQYAGISALKETAKDVATMKETYDQRRLYMLERLRQLGVSIITEPKGAFYVFANFKDFTDDSKKLAFDILENIHVGVTPGIDFGSNGEGYLRFSYANSIENIEQAFNRLEKYFKR